jgi:hypothetical protein
MDAAFSRAVPITVPTPTPRSATGPASSTNWRGPGWFVGALEKVDADDAVPSSGGCRLRTSCARRAKKPLSPRGSHPSMAARRPTPRTKATTMPVVTRNHTDAVGTGRRRQKAPDTRSTAPDESPDPSGERSSAALAAITPVSAIATTLPRAVRRWLGHVGTKDATSPVRHPEEPGAGETEDGASSDVRRRQWRWPWPPW